MPSDDCPAATINGEPAELSCGPNSLCQTPVFKSLILAPLEPGVPFIAYLLPGTGAVPELDFSVVGVDVDFPCPADLTGDGVVNAADLAELLAAWGQCRE